MFKRSFILFIFVSLFSNVRSLDQTTFAVSGATVGVFSTLFSAYCLYNTFGIVSESSELAQDEDSFFDCGKYSPFIYLSINTAIHIYMTYLSILIFSKNNSSLFYRINGATGLTLGTLATLFWTYKGYKEKDSFPKKIESIAAAVNLFLMLISGYAML